MNINAKILTIIAGASPDYPSFLEQLPPELIQGKQVPPALLEEMVQSLKQDDTYAPAIDAMQRSGVVPELSFDFGASLGTAGVLVAALFLLRTHVKIHRLPSGEWELLIEHQPGDNELMGKVLDALKDLFPSGK